MWYIIKAVAVEDVEKITGFDWSINEF